MDNNLFQITKALRVFLEVEPLLDSDIRRSSASTRGGSGFAMAIGAFLSRSWAPQRLLSSSSLFRRNAVIGYGVGLFAFMLALALRFALEASIPKFPFITFIPAIIISAFLAGTRAGIFC